MASSRDLKELLPHVQVAAMLFLQNCSTVGLTVLIYCTYRPREEQAMVYASGRTIAGPILTWARPGYSWHEWRRAFDAVPLVSGKPIWHVDPNTIPLWQLMGDCGKRAGFEWAGDWSEEKREFPHFQMRNGLTIAEVLKHGTALNTSRVGPG